MFLQKNYKKYDCIYLYAIMSVSHFNVYGTLNTIIALSWLLEEVENI